MEIINKPFGLAIAYLLPGFIALAGIAPFVPVVFGWLQAGQTASLGAPVYAVLAATASGMIVSSFRWLVLDPILVFTGVLASSFNARALEEHPEAFNYLVENHYRYYQFYANALVAVIWTYIILRCFKTSSMVGWGSDLGVLILCTVLFISSRDALKKYRSRIKILVE